MPSYMVACRPDAMDAEVDVFKIFVVEKGGTILEEIDSAKGFKVSFDDDALAMLKGHESVVFAEKFDG